jgi:hypothetical protein
MPVPSDTGEPVDVLFDPDNSNVIYAIAARGVYRSADFGEEYLGQTWESLTKELPPLAPVQWVVAPGTPGRLYAVSGPRLFTRTLDDPRWSRSKDFGLEEYAEVYPWVAVDPGNPARLFVGMKMAHEELGTLSLVQESLDAGNTWSNDQEALMAEYARHGIAGVIRLGVRSELKHLAVDPADPARLYAAGTRGVLRSADGGKTWQPLEEGLDIPLVQTLFRPRHSKWLFAGTPGGLYVSKDGGTTWEDANLWLQFTGNTRRELGGAAFLDAYWRARYHGFIDDAAADK